MDQISPERNLWSVVAIVLSDENILTVNIFYTINTINFQSISFVISVSDRMHDNQSQHVAFNRAPRRDNMDRYWTKQTQQSTPVDQKQWKDIY